jgi:hypothetical protein
MKEAADFQVHDVDGRADRVPRTQCGGDVQAVKVSGEANEMIPSLVEALPPVAIKERRLPLADQKLDLVGLAEQLDQTHLTGPNLGDDRVREQERCYRCERQDHTCLKWAYQMGASRPRKPRCDVS